MTYGIQIRSNPELTRKVKAEADRRGVKAVARVAAELLSERLMQLESIRNNSPTTVSANQA